MAEEPLNINRIVQIALNLAEPIHEDVFENEVIRNRNYYEVIIPNYTDVQFCEHFRMSRQTFEVCILQILLHCLCVKQVICFFKVLLNRIGQLNPGPMTIRLEKKLLFTIWMLSKPESFLAASDRFGLSKSTGHFVFYEMIELIC